MGRKLSIPEDGIPHQCKENDNTIVIIKNGDNIDELYFGNTDMPKEGWTVIGYKDLMAAIDKAKSHGGT